MPTELPPVPLTLEGAAVLHQMMKFRRSAWNAAHTARRSEILDELAAVLGPLRGSGMYSVFGHKADLLLVHFRNDFEELKAAELAVGKLALSEFLEPSQSYLSVVELGLYDSTAQVYSSLAERGVEPHSAEWNSAIEEVLARQRKAMHPRLFPEIPPARYLCFYPMDRKRAEAKNWYQVPMAERQRMMHEHGMIGRRYAGEVKQIISGSIGFDDWEWGVDLFADDPVVFKKLIYEMRFDEVSAVYALFGAFYVGVRCEPSQLGGLLDGQLPEWHKTKN
jgi:chlorite dismutase